MNEDRIKLLQTIRNIANEKGIAEITLEKLHNLSEIPQDILSKYYSQDEDLVTDILAEERKKFEVIFIDHDFEGYYDAIDILFTVSKEIALGLGTASELAIAERFIFKDTGFWNEFAAEQFRAEFKEVAYWVEYDEEAYRSEFKDRAYHFGFDDSDLQEAFKDRAERLDFTSKAFRLEFKGKTYYFLFKNYE